MSIFGKSLNKKDSNLVILVASQDYRKKVIESAPNESELEKRQHYLMGALHESLSLDFLAKYIHNYFNDAEVSFPSDLLIGQIRETLIHNEEKMNEEGITIHSSIKDLNF